MPDESLSSRGLSGVGGDVKRRLKTYADDWRDGLHPKVAAATAFLFFACVAPAVAFGGLMEVMTSGAIGVIEMMVATAICGTLYALFAGQPLTILGGTGPLLVFTAILFETCRRLELPFLPTYAWVGLWTGVFTVALALVGASRFVALFTRFTDETFAALISLIFVYEALINVAKAFPSPQVADDAALFGVILALGTYMFARSLGRLRQRPYLWAPVRELVADFGPAMAVLLMVWARTLLPTVKVAGLSVPETFATTAGRPWLVALSGVPSWVPFAAIGPALLVSVLVFMDQNVTVRIVHSPHHNLKRGAAYHWDLLLVGLFIGGCSMFGLPWLVAATVRSVAHVRALGGGDGGGRTLENRVSPLLVHALIGAALLVTHLLRLIPMPVLYGLFLYMGLSSMGGNQLFERLRLWLTDPRLYPEVHWVKRVPHRTIHLFTLVQVICLGFLWLVKSSVVGILFPLVIALLVPVRALLGRFIPKEHLEALDADEAPKEVENEFVGP